jgi:hypothetical protein
LRFEEGGRGQTADWSYRPRELERESLGSRPTVVAQAHQGAISVAVPEFKMTRDKMVGISTVGAPQRSSYKPPLHATIFIAVIVVVSHDRWPQRARAGKARSRGIGRSKIDNDDVIFSPDNMAVRISDRLHGRNSYCFPSSDASV